jgi:hypothetical protein
MERVPYPLMAHKDRRRRAGGKLYNLHCAHRVPALMTDAGARFVVGKERCDETAARQVFMTSLRAMQI